MIVASSQDQNKNQIQHFSGLAYDWWDENGPLKTLHHINSARLAYIQQQTILQGQRVIDVGCGAGILTESLARADAVVTGIDGSSALIQVAKLHAENAELSIDYQVAEIVEYSQQYRQQFDIVTCFELLEHVSDYGAIVRACAELCKPGGKVFFSTIDRTPIAFLTAIVAAEHLLKLVPKGTHQYKNLIRPTELNEEARKAGLLPCNLQGLRYNPLTKTAALTQHHGVNYFATYRKASI